MTGGPERSGRGECMETKASYILVGAFSLIIIAGALVFVLWIGGGGQRETIPYMVNVDQSVAGLSVGNDVVFNGVRVGQVSRITLSPRDPQSVTVVVRVAPDTPVRANSVATLEVRGITGIAMVSISGGTVDSPLVSSSDGNMKVIPYRPSSIQEIMSSAPAILSNLSELTERANAMLSPANAESFSQLLSSLSRTMRGVADGSDSLEKTLATVNDAAENIGTLAASITRLSDSTRVLVDRQFTDTLNSFTQTAAGIQRIVTSVEPGIQRVVRETGDELHTLLAEARSLLQRLARLTSDLESDPRRFFLGNSVPEYSIP